MRRAWLLAALALAACPAPVLNDCLVDGGKIEVDAGVDAGAVDAGQDSGTPDAGTKKLAWCLDRPTDFAAAPGTSLPCDLVSPAFVSP